MRAEPRYLRQKGIVAACVAGLRGVTRRKVPAIGVACDIDAPAPVDGNALARIEGRVALDEILNRFPDWEVDLDAAVFSSSSAVRGWDSMPAYV